MKHAITAAPIIACMESPQGALKMLVMWTQQFQSRNENIHKTGKIRLNIKGRDRELEETWRYAIPLITDTSLWFIYDEDPFFLTDRKSYMLSKN